MRRWGVDTKRLMLVVPSVAVAIAGFALLGPGRPRPVSYVRVHAASKVRDARALRVELLERVEAGIDLSRALPAATLLVDDGARACASGDVAAEPSGVAVVALGPFSPACAPGAKLRARLVADGKVLHQTPLVDAPLPAALAAPPDHFQFHDCVQTRIGQFRRQSVAHSCRGRSPRRARQPEGRRRFDRNHAVQRVRLNQSNHSELPPCRDHRRSRDRPINDTRRASRRISHSIVGVCNFAVPTRCCAP